MRSNPIPRLIVKVWHASKLRCPVCRTMSLCGHCVVTIAGVQLGLGICDTRCLPRRVVCSLCELHRGAAANSQERGRCEGSTPRAASSSSNQQAGTLLYNQEILDSRGATPKAKPPKGEEDRFSQTSRLELSCYSFCGRANCPGGLTRPQCL